MPCTRLRSTTPCPWLAPCSCAPVFLPPTALLNAGRGSQAGCLFPGSLNAAPVAVRAFGGPWEPVVCMRSSDLCMHALRVRMLLFVQVLCVHTICVHVLLFVQVLCAAPAALPAAIPRWSNRDPSPSPKCS